MCCSVLQCVAVCCSVLQCVAHVWLNFTKCWRLHANTTPHAPHSFHLLLQEGRGVEWRRGGDRRGKIFRPFVFFQESSIEVSGSHTNSMEVLTSGGHTNPPFIFLSMCPLQLSSATSCPDSSPSATRVAAIELVWLPPTLVSAITIAAVEKTEISAKPRLPKPTSLCVRPLTCISSRASKFWA